MAIYKEQIKVIREDKFAEEPTYDSNKVLVVDATDWTLTPDHGVITQETLSTTGTTVALPGGYSVTGSVTVPARMSQIDKLNEIGFGESITKTFSKTDNDGNLVYEIKASLAIPTQKELPSFTVYHLYPEPEVVDVVLGTVFTNMRVEFATDRVLTYSYDITAQKNKTVKDQTELAKKKYQNESMPIQDYVRALDAALFADIKVLKLEVKQNSDTNTTTVKFIDEKENIEYIPVEESDGYYKKVKAEIDGKEEQFSLIDAIPIKKESDAGENYNQVRYLVGRKIINVSTVRLDLRIENAGRDAYRLGSRFANEYPLRKVVRQDYTGSMTIDFTMTDTAENVDSMELYNEFINGARTEEIIEPTEAGIGKMSVVIKVGSAYDIRSKTDKADVRVPHNFGMNVNDPFMCNADIDKPNLGSPNRCLYILPNVVLERADKRDTVGTLKTIDLTIRMLPDDELFKGYVVQGDGMPKPRSIDSLRAFAVSWLKPQN